MYQMPKTKSLSKQFILTPCSLVSVLKIKGQVNIEEFVMPPGKEKGALRRNLTDNAPARVPSPVGFR